MQSIKEFYDSKDAAGVPKHYTHDIADFEVKNRKKKTCYVHLHLIRQSVNFEQYLVQDLKQDGKYRQFSR